MPDIKEFAKGLSVGIIMDGNGRWAKKRNLPRSAGHKRGSEVFEDIADYCSELRFSSVFFYAFSTENWIRPADEISGIMKLFGEFLVRAYDFKNRNNRIVFIGERSRLAKEHLKLMDEIERDTKDKTGMLLNIAINYGSRQEIVHSAQELAKKVKNGEISPEDINEELLSNNLYTKNQKDPDFILRPSGEKRLSNFMLWQGAYSELVEMNVLWPDFTRADMDTAILEYAKRQRRFGGI